MWTRTAILVLVNMVHCAARADISIVCDEQAQVEDILNTTRNHGFQEATQKLRAYSGLRDEHNEPTCEVSRAPHPAKVGAVVAQFKSIEFLPDQLHDVLIVEIRVGERTLYGTLNTFIALKAKELGI